MTTQSISGFNAEFGAITAAHNELEQMLTFGETEGTNSTAMQDLFSRSVDLQERADSLVNSYPQNLGAQRLQASVQKTQGCVLAAMEHFCLLSQTHCEENRDASEGLEARCVVLTDELLPELIGMIAKKLDVKNFFSCACVSKPLNIATTRCITTITPIELAAICSPRLTIIDAKMMGLEVSNEPPLKNFTLECMKAVSVLGPHVEGDEGLMLLTMGHTLNQLVQIAKDVGMVVNFYPNQILQEQGEVPVQTDRVLLTNNVVLQSRNKDVSKQQALVKTLNCALPTVQEYVVLCVFTYKIFNRCVYRRGLGNGRWTYGCTSTQVGGLHLVVGDSAPARLDVRHNYFVLEKVGAGGRWKCLAIGN